MPIIDPPDVSPQLRQGDILRDVALYVTERSWDEEGGRHAKAPHALCLVLSRPCVAIHKAHVIVAGIERYPDQLPRDVQSFDEVIAFLAEMRDGEGSPDLFYLGQLPAKGGRFCARLDALYSIEVPSDPVVRASFVKERRIGSLSAEFSRDLHLRLFRAFASLGFSDQGWLPDGDLKWVVRAGSVEVKRAETELEEAKATEARQEARGRQSDPQVIDKLEGKLASLKAKLQPFLDEWESRDTTGSEGQGGSETDMLDDSVTA